ncbi:MULTISPECIES: molybdopterin cofactor-binding domain-containing protein [unclassified Streptomyces]|uniref:molybdopterin-dependent oxidoreductase n=1 Tax=unclassified Streptomyces TaxID=2593676 RepID=UPI000DBA23AB|nr:MULTISPECIES: molybdopterin cofactor-binding domain-containing protein [unclassified Streptomyces]MYT68248.1 molybdopterin-dependent oxidoreductase [Streptomyces sp. SID8367]RAJ76880.1 carbon-monoxide dehydrogenase large subunit [Streptomyces sp. PsTaAH-137]
MTTPAHASHGCGTLADHLRDCEGRTSVRLGCEEGVCGSCTVLLDGRTARACTVLAAQAQGLPVRTAEDTGDALMRHLRQVLWAEHAFQCGFCASGFLLEIHALLTENPDPTEAEVRHHLAGNLCRCTGYESIVRAVLTAARTRPREHDPAGPPDPAGVTDPTVGTRALRAEDRTVLDGRARYIADLVVPGTLHARFVRGDRPHARITGIDASAARAAPGVVAVLTAADLRDSLNPIGIACPLEGYTAPAFTPLAEDRVRFEGDPVALVVATGQAAAEDAAALVAVGYEDLPPVLDARAGDDGTQPPLFPDLPGNVLYTEHRGHGDVSGAFARAARVVRHRLRQDRVQNAPLEPRGGLASWDSAEGRLTYDVASQSPTSHRQYLADVLGLGLDAVRVRVPANMGGSFGIKGGVFREDIAVCWASRHLARPVRWIEDRREHLIAAGQARGEEVDIEAALGPDGELLALRADLVVDQGAYPVPPIASAVFVALVGCLIPNAYHVPAYEFTGRLALTNRTPYVAYRGPWEMATFAAERTMDLLARELGEEPADYRLRHLAPVGGPDPRTATGARLTDVPALGSTLRRARAEADVGEFRARQARDRAAGRLTGLGIATLLEPAPGPWSLHEAMGAHMGPEPVRVLFTPEGRPQIRTGQIPHGQGHVTTLAQIAASTLGLPLHTVEVVHGDTDTVPYSLAGTGASRAAALAGGGVLRASRTLRARLLADTARRTGRPAARLDIAAGEVVDTRDGRALGTVTALAAACVATSGEPSPLDVSEVFDSEETGWAEATHCCWVEIDPDLGTVAVERYLIVADSGRIINPAVADGQLRGGAVQGIGTVLQERSGYGPDGAQLARDLTEYLLPTTRTAPAIEVVHLESPRAGDVPYRGLGEGGAVLAPAAVVGAVEDALAHRGVRLTERHLPPWRVLGLLAADRTPTPVPEYR